LPPATIEFRYPPGHRQAVERGLVAQQAPFFEVLLQQGLEVALSQLPDLVWSQHHVPTHEVK
jgi:hypothetical protein